jgi:hypothetical protein
MTKKKNFMKNRHIYVFLNPTKDIQAPGKASSLTELFKHEIFVHFVLGIILACLVPEPDQVTHLNLDPIRIRNTAGMYLTKNIRGFLFLTVSWLRNPSVQKI